MTAPKDPAPLAPLTFLGWLDRIGERRQARRLLKMRSERHIDARGWVGLGVYALTVMVLWMAALYPELRGDEFFKTIATLIIGTAFVNGVVSWAYSATKQGGELAKRNADLVERQANASPPIADA